jgi:CRISPR/Cas system-associated exonuclease Cas4 (RecB family)
MHEGSSNTKSLCTVLTKLDLVSSDASTCKGQPLVSQATLDGALHGIGSCVDASAREILIVLVRKAAEREWVMGWWGADGRACPGS